jgi:hypothetical protein
MTPKLPPLTKYRCTICNRRLREGRYVYSRFTKARYCVEVAVCHKAIAKRKTTRGE